MAFPVVLNGRTYTLADFEGTNYVDGLPDAFEDFVTHAGDIYNDTSTSSAAIGTGSKTFTVSSGKPYQAGTPLRIADAAAPQTNFLDCIVTSYSGTSLVVNAFGFAGSGTKTSWTINIGGAKTVDGTLAISQGGTGATTAAAAATALGLGTGDSPTFAGLTVTGTTSFSDIDIDNVGDIAVDSISGDADSNTSITFTGSDAIDIAAGGSTIQSITTSGISVTGKGTITNTSAGVATALELKNNTSGANNRAAIDLYSASTKYVTLEGGYGSAAPEFNVKVGNPPALVMTANSSGIDVTGSVKTDALEVEAATPVLEIDSTTSANLATLQFSTSGTVDSKITHQASTGTMTIDSGRSASWGGEIDFVTDTDRRVRIASNGDVSFYEDTGTTQSFFWDASASSLGLGTTSPNVHGWTKALSIDGGASSSGAVELNQNGTKVGALGLQGDQRLQVVNHSANPITFHTNGIANERMRILSNGRVSIGSSPSSSSELLNLTATSGNGAGIESAGNGNTLGSTSAFYGQGSGSDAYVWNRANNPILFGTNNTECARFGSAGDMEIGSQRVNQGGGRYLDIYNRGTDSVSFSILRLITEQVGSTSLSTSEFYKRKNGETTLWNHETSSDAYLRAGIGVTEGWRIHSSGNVLLGKTSPAFGTAGVELNNSGVAGKVWITRSGGEPLALNRETNDGPIIEVYQGSGTQVGVWRSRGGAVSTIVLDTRSNGSGLTGSTNGLLPVNEGGSTSDDGVDLGSSSSRFRDIYAGNSTIQTSDRNEKQDIEELSDAEQRVAVACKGLLRKFRWKSAVEEKGDDARIHFGIVAQDLQDAFAAEGLDAGRYGMFINSTWTDEETGEERSRMGVRYSELLAFIISAI